MKTPQKGRCLVITGPSGSGKTTLVEHVLGKLPYAARVITTTTRAKRPHEAEGIHYFFLTLPEFEAKVAADEFVEHAPVYGNMYGVERTRLEERLWQYEVVFATVDIQGARTYRERVPGCELVMVSAPLTDLERRLALAERETTTEDERNARRELATTELAFAGLCDHTIDNADGNLRAAIEKLLAIARNTRSACDRRD